ncbi:L-aspartate oxidase [Candidatus Pandoraea novymonadis]|uniref:L-aspartate oxidase n=1 Tax=Candidatus Pandoraea novymonadis TaxID=1808959 RepID=A0ABX5FFA5_9BURK|nr:L-aspartate oxidase [Candidatus Pandoraea novymonadis]PSB91837.1 L-aspartate oxidase [Candidatus Pandoraea novymonadis]
MNFDVVIVGSGLAGQSVALHLADRCRVALIAKRQIQEGASNWAQGGIAAVLDPTDSHSQHITDTLLAGAGLCDESNSRYIIEHSRDVIEWLIKQGVSFTRDSSSELGFHLTREGGHTHRRIIHAADATGHAVITTLSERVRNHPNITVLENYFAIDLIISNQSQSLSNTECYCQGLYVQNIESSQIHVITAKQTVLATGGAGKVYLYTTNPDTSTGDGIAMAWRIGCRIANMEFIQFHPTCLYHPYAKSFLISEAVRGEGGVLLLPDGTRFMPLHDPRAELAPRDIVARAIDFEMKKHGLDCVYLDISHQSSSFLNEHFPTILSRCHELGIDITKQGIPVVPAAHYTCGGIVTDINGRTDLSRLYAIGETAYTGLHGANRLASNSLLECLVLGKATAEDILRQNSLKTTIKINAPEWDESRVCDPDEEVVVAHNWDELRRMMWNYVGIVRTTKRLERAQHRIHLLREEIAEYYANFRVSRDLLELRNLVDVASLIIESALSRRESRGLHFSRDFPNTLPKALPTVLSPKKHREKNKPRL